MCPYMYAYLESRRKSVLVSVMLIGADDKVLMKQVFSFSSLYTEIYTHQN